MARKKIQSKTTSKGRKNLQAKSKAQVKAATSRKKPGRKPTKKIPVGYTLLKRDETSLVKAYSQLEKEFDSFADLLNAFCYNDGDKLKAAVEANKALTNLNKGISAFKKALMKTKQGLKPVYTVKANE